MYRFINFKGFADATLDLRTPVTMLIGRNGAGKSNAVEAIRVLAAFLQRYKFSEINDEKRGGTPMVRGGLERAVRLGTSSFALEYAEPSTADAMRYRLGYEHMPTSTTVAPVKRHVVEDLTVARGNLLRTVPKDGIWMIEVATKQSEREGFPTFRTAMGPAAADMASISNYWGDDCQLSLPNLWTAANRLKEGAQQVVLVAPDPTRMREAATKNDVDLAEDMRNVAAILEVLKHGTTEQKSIFGGIVQLLKSLPEEDIKDLNIVEIPELKKVLFGIDTQAGLLSADVLSHGTLMTLGLATAAEACWPGSTVVIEDLDAGIHPARVHALFNHLWQVAERRNLRILVTTHNTALLDSLTADQLRGVVLCWWDEATKSSQLKHLTDLPDPEPFLSPGHLGSDVTKERLRSRLVPEADYNKLRDKGLDDTFARLGKLSSWREAK